MLVEQLRSRLKDAMKQRKVTEKEILRVALGEIDTLASRQSTPLTDAEVQAVLRKLVKSNEETLNATSDAAVQATLNEENAVLRSLLPQTLDVAQIVAALAPVADQIAAANAAGPATGIAMKHLKGLAVNVEGKDVAQAVSRLRQG